MSDKAGLGGLVDIAMQVITRPADFYRGMPKTSGFADPVIFVVVMAAVTGVIGAIFSIIGFGPTAGMAAGMGQIIFVPVFALIGSFIGAAILFVIWRLMGSGESYETAYRCAAYASSIGPVLAVLAIVPYLGSVISSLWSMYLMAIAGIEAHQLDRKKSFIVFGILAFLFLMMNISGERAQRKMANHMEDITIQMDQLGKQLEHTKDMTPEQAGEAFGQFMKGLQKATEEAEKDK